MRSKCTWEAETGGQKGSRGVAGTMGRSLKLEAISMEKDTANDIIGETGSLPLRRS